MRTAEHLGAHPRLFFVLAFLFVCPQKRERVLILEILQDILAAIGVVLNGIPQGLLALTYGFASVPTAIGFAVGAVSCGALNSVAPISFQAETIVMAGSMGKTRRERL